ncbi:MAG: hypothetical protein KY476_17855 [Planctomycetes bacterium]|nr:hypothetical protein [Planctomycetota bacterium]
MNSQIQAASIARRIQQQRQLREQFTAQRDRLGPELTDATGSASRRNVLAELERKREAKRKSVREFVASRAARREAEADELASLPEDERAARIREQNERCAAARLNLAQTLRSRGRPADACKWLERLVDEYPETAAAHEAREILAWLPSAISAG